MMAVRRAAQSAASETAEHHILPVTKQKYLEIMEQKPSRQTHSFNNLRYELKGSEFFVFFT
jgi:hypothetical protein